MRDRRRYKRKPTTREWELARAAKRVKATAARRMMDAGIRAAYIRQSVAEVEAFNEWVEEGKLPA